MSSINPAVLSCRSEAAVRTYQCGTLTYTKIGLTFLFASLLWGDFCWALMDQVVPSILPLKLKSYDCPNWLIGAIMTVAPNALGIGVAPWIAFKSDRLRSRWGRRIPFLAVSMPFLCLSLVLLGYSENMAAWLHAHAEFLQVYAPATIALALIAVFLLMFQFFNLFVNTAFWYLFNDVVPPQFLARLIGGLRVIGGLAVVGYNYFVFRYADSHMREIFIGAAILYFVGFSILCLRVKEGQYPPLEIKPEAKQRGIFAAFGKECFSHRFYWFSFLFMAFFMVSGGAAIFNVFFYMQMGLTLESIGSYNAITMFVSLFAMYFVMSFIDRWHPMRVSTYYALFAVVGAVMNWVWLLVDLPERCFFWIFTVYGIAGVLQVGLSGVMGLPRSMRIFPRSRYGQFSAAQGLIGGLCGIFGGVLIGVFVDVIRGFCGENGDFSYRFLFLWPTFFGCLAAVFGVLSYREWYKLGGDDDYRAPAEWEIAGSEPMPRVRTIGPSSKYLRIAFGVFRTIVFAGVAWVALIILLLQYRGVDFRWRGMILLLLALAIAVGWRRIEIAIRRDVEASRSHRALRRGIPHHGVLMFAMGQQAIVFVNWIIQTVISLRLEEYGFIFVFSLGQLAGTLLVAGIIHILSCIERGHLSQVDVLLSEGETR